MNSKAGSVVAVVLAGAAVLAGGLFYSAVIQQDRELRDAAIKEPLTYVGLEYKMVSRTQVYELRLHQCGLPTQMATVRRTYDDVAPDLNTRDYMWAIKGIEMIPDLMVFRQASIHLKGDAVRFVGPRLLEALARKQTKLRVLQLSGDEFVEYDSCCDTPYLDADKIRSNFRSFDQLVWLKIERNRHGDKLFEVIRDCRTLKQLAIGPPTEDAPRVTADALGRLPSDAPLRWLSIEGGDFTAADLDAMRNGAAKTLKGLVLTKCNVGDHGIDTLKVFPILEQLFLEGCPITDAGVEILTTPGLMPKLLEVHVKGTAVTAECKTRIEERSPVKIIRS